MQILRSLASFLQVIYTASIVCPQVRRHHSRKWGANARTFTFGTKVGDFDDVPCLGPRLTNVPEIRMNERWAMKDVFVMAAALMGLAAASCGVPPDRWEPAEGANSDVEPPRALIGSASHACRTNRSTLPKAISGFVRVRGERFREALAKLHEPAWDGRTVGTGLFYNMLGRWSGNEVGYVDGQNFEVEGPPTYVVVDETICHFVSWKIISIAGFYSDGQVYRLSTLVLATGNIVNTDLAL